MKLEFYLVWVTSKVKVSHSVQRDRMLTRVIKCAHLWTPRMLPTSFMIVQINVPAVSDSFRRFIKLFCNCLNYPQLVLASMLSSSWINLLIVCESCSEALRRFEWIFSHLQILDMSVAAGLPHWRAFNQQPGLHPVTLGIKAPPLQRHMRWLDLWLVDSKTEALPPPS